MLDEKYNQIFTLKDGRKLGYAEFGDPSGKPVIYFHGWLGGRLDPYVCVLFEKEIDCRIISVDRPGIGLSDFKKNRTILDWSDDVVELANHLGIEKFHVLGMSGGGPYVAACAYKIPERLLSAGIIGGMGPYEETKRMLKNPNRFLFVLFDKIPFSIKLILYPMWNRFLKMKFDEKARRMLARQGNRLPKPDKVFYEDSIFQEFLLNHLKDILQQKTKKGAFIDGKLFIKSWNFSLEEIPEDLKFYIWHGEIDKNVPVEIGKYYASKVSNSTAFFYPDEAHLSVLVNKIEEIIEIINK